MLYWQEKQRDAVVVTQVLKCSQAGGQGFDPCLQQFAFSELFSGDLVRVQAKGSLYSLTNPHVRWPDLVAKPWGHMMDSVNAGTLDQDSPNGPAANGPTKICY